MRKIIAALQVSLDGFIEGPNEELDWVDSWEDPFDIVGKVDAFILGARMYPGYEQYWQAVLDNPRGILPFTGRRFATFDFLDVSRPLCSLPLIPATPKQLLDRGFTRKRSGATVGRSNRERHRACTGNRAERCSRECRRNPARNPKLHDGISWS